jgi:hypothetical protein
MLPPPRRLRRRRFRMSEILSTNEVLEAVLLGKELEQKHKDGSCWKPSSLTVKDGGIMELLTCEFRLKPKEQRDFAGALEWLREGKAIRRPCWGPEEKWFICPSGYLNNVRRTNMSILTTKENLFAKDWEVA